MNATPDIWTIFECPCDRTGLTKNRTIEIWCNGERICTMSGFDSPEAREHAERIIRCVNAHSVLTDTIDILRKVGVV